MAFFFERFLDATPQTVGAGAYHNNPDRGAACLCLFMAIHNRRPRNLKELLEWAYSSKGRDAFVACASGEIKDFDPYHEVREQGRIAEIIRELTPDISVIPGSARRPAQVDQYAAAAVKDRSLPSEKGQGVKSMNINPPSASFLAVQNELQHVYETSFYDRDRRTLALAKALLMKIYYDASVSTIADNPGVIAAVAVLLAAVTDHLKVRVDAQKAGLFSGLLSVRPVFNHSSEAVDKAIKALNNAIHEAWIEAEGRDPRDDDAYHDAFCAITGMPP